MLRDDPAITARTVIRVDTESHDRAESADLEELKAIVDANAYMTLATAGVDGMPWASPVWFAHTGYIEFLWASRPTARHSQNIAVHSSVGIVVFDSTVPPGHGRAVYMEATADIVPPGELDDAIATYSQESAAQGIPAWTVADVSGDAPHRLYRARAVRHYVLNERDQRIPVRLEPVGREG
jgi:Pyridoxamine 5'-phosphate oxidase